MLDLADHIKNKSAPSQCVPTAVEAKLSHITGIKAIVFDIYGTLFTSEAGELNTNSSDLKNAYIIESVQTVLKDTTPLLNTHLSSDFISTIQSIHSAATQKGIPHPEVDIKRVWHRILCPHYPDLTNDQIAEIAVIYETLSNPVWPMPEAKETLQFIKSKGFSLGIISNAQFYTPLLFEALLGHPLSALGFQEDYCIYSYLEGSAKPDKALFLRLLERLKRQDIYANEILYIGNDMKNDIAPAQCLGIHTVLFAGDKRSLRMRSEMNLTPPSAIITSLSQIKTIVT